MNQQQQGRLGWDQVSEFTPMLFLHDHQASPPQSARRLWEAIIQADLDRYDCDIAKSLVKSRLMTLALVQQEFRILVWRQGSMIQPLDILGFLDAPIAEISALTGQADIEPIQAVLIVDAANRRQLSPVVRTAFGDTESLFKTLAFPEGMPDELARTGLEEALDASQTPAPANEMMAQLAEPPNPSAGVEFIENNLVRTMQYAA